VHVIFIRVDAQIIKKKIADTSKLEPEGLHEANYILRESPQTLVAPYL
jgi:hypothetical protein